MNNDNLYESLPPESENWDEFQWELVMRKCDRFAHRYFNAAERFSDLPGEEQLIQSQLKGFKLPSVEDSDFILDDEDIDAEEYSDEDLQDVFFYENYPPYQLLLRISWGWTNILSIYLQKDVYTEGTSALFHLGRALSYFAGALADGHYETPSNNIASCKRALEQVNLALGAIESITEKNPQYVRATQTIFRRLCEVHDRMVDHMSHLRSFAKR